ncbi:MAG: efflux RND transporter periplasmic adaptor subunit [Planctomycetia bacterium]|nr:efflux RND transporter periplasmic adaptor subunit [Planctomycetia bacterium]
MKWKMALNIRKMLASLSVAVLGIGLLVVAVVVATKAVTIDVAWNKKIAPEETAVAARELGPNDRTDAVHEVEKEYMEEAVGTLKAASRTEISARVLAPIERITVRAGQRVRQRDELIVLDRRAVETQKSQVQASLVAAQASVQQAEANFKRDSQLLTSRTISQEQFDQSKANVEVARAQLNHAQQALAESEVMLSYTTILAPRSGIIVDRLAEEGDMAQPGVPLLVLYDPTSLRLEVPVMENLALKLRVGDELSVRIDALNRTVTAKVDEIVPQAEAASRSFLVKVAMPKEEGLFEGMFGRLLIPAGKRRHLCLATAAIDKIGQLELVDVVEPDKTLQRRFVKTGRLGMPGRVEVLSGLAVGERVRLREVVSGQ